MEKKPNYNNIFFSTGCHHLNYAILNKRKGQSRMNSPARLATLGTQDTRRRQTEKNQKKPKKTHTQHNMRWTPLFTQANTYNVNKSRALLQTSFNWKERRTEHRFYAEIGHHNTKPRT